VIESFGDEQRFAAFSTEDRNRAADAPMEDRQPSDTWVIQGLLVARGLLGNAPGTQPGDWTSDTVDAGLLGTVLADPARAEATVRRPWPRLPAAAQWAGPRGADPG
jgi:hypothetical protein